MISAFDDLDAQDATHKPGGASLRTTPRCWIGVATTEVTSTTSGARSNVCKRRIAGSTVKRLGKWVSTITNIQCGHRLTGKADSKKLKGNLIEILHCSWLFYTSIRVAPRSQPSQRGSLSVGVSGVHFPTAEIRMAVQTTRA